MRKFFWKMTGRKRPVSRCFSVVIALAEVWAMGSGTTFGAGQSPDLHGLAFSKGETKIFWVRMRERADLRAADEIPDFKKQGKFVAEALKQTAKRGQANVVSLLKSEKKPFKTFWISNTIRVIADESLAKTLAMRPDVEGVYPDVKVKLALQSVSPDLISSRIGHIEWNVRQVNAPAVWNEGITGKGVVVGVLDSGFVFHPALTPHYRGLRGKDLINHNYNWFDGVQSKNCQSEPCDSIGHGTHVTGTILGGDGPGPNSIDNPYDIGVAPMAKFISCRGFALTSASTADILSCAEWFLAPTDLLGRYPDPSRRPHIVNNSWYSTNYDPVFRDIFQAWQASGILPVVASGNAGPVCSRIGSPGAYPEAFTVGALTKSKVIAPFSSKGPVLGSPGLMKPDVVTGGENVRSTSIDGGFTIMSGTSMSTPAASGVAALVMSAQPVLKRRPVRVAKLLRETASPILSSGCSNNTTETSPNYVYGWGLMDAYQAVSVAKTADGR